MLITQVVTWPEGSRLTGIDGTPQGRNPGMDGVVSLHLLDLPDGQQGNTEISMARAHLPFASTSIHGVYPDGSQWMLLTQTVPLPVDAGVESTEAAEQMLNAQMIRYLNLNPFASVVSERFMNRYELLTGYQQQGVDFAGLGEWSVDELLAGLITEMCSVELAEVVEGNKLGCTFPDLDHYCTGNAFTDVFAQWSRGLLAPSGDVDEWSPGEVTWTPAIEVPGNDATFADIQEFALTFNAYVRFDGDLATFANGARAMWQKMGQMPWDLDSLRAALFYEQRRMRHLGAEPNDQDMNYLRALIAGIRNRAGDHLPGPPDAFP